MIVFYLLVSVMPMVRHPLWSDLVGDLTIIKYLGGLCLLYAFFHLPNSALPFRMFATGQTRCFAVLALLGMASYLTMGPQLPLEVSPFMNYLSFMMFLFIVAVVIDSESALRWTLLTAAGSLAYASLHTIREWQKYGGMAAGYRPGWITGDPNYFSVSVVLCLPVVFYLIRAEQPAWERRFCYFTLGTTLFALTLAASRGALLALVATLLLVVIRSGRRLRSLMIGTAVILPLLVIAPSTPLDRLLAPSLSDQEAADNRSRIWDAGMIMIQERPITGIGAGNFKPVVTRFVSEHEATVAHNTYLEVAAELGLVGLALFLAIFAATFRSLARVRRLEPDRDHLLHRASLGIEGGLLAFMVAVFFISAEYQKFFWLLVFLSASLEALAVDRASHATQLATPPTGAGWPRKTRVGLAR